MSATTRHRLARSTAIFSHRDRHLAGLGLVREIVAAYYFGVSGKINAFTVAIQIPNLVRALVADAALSGAFVPVFSELLEKGEKKRAWRVASTLFWLTHARPRRRHGALHPARAAAHAALRRSRRRLRPRRRAVARALPDRRDPRAVRDRRRDPEHVSPVRGPGARAGRLEPRHRPRPRPRRAADRRRERQLYLYAGVVVLGTLVQLLLPFPWLRRLDGTPDHGARLARSGRHGACSC